MGFRRQILIAGVLATLSTVVPPCWSGERPFTIAFKGSLTTSSQLFTNPDSPDPVEQAAFLPLENQFGVGVEFKYSIPETRLAASLSAEYIEASFSGLTAEQIPYADGYRVIPVEVTVFFIIPISGPTFDVYMGGGLGAYVGERTYSIGGVEAAPSASRTGAGIHILGGMMVRVTEILGVTGEMKFRDLQFEASNKFPVSRITYGNRVVNVSTEPFASEVHTDGIILQVGLALNF